MKTAEIVYLIDGVRVPKDIWHSRKLFGETASARFDYHEMPDLRKRKLRTSRAPAGRDGRPPER